MRFALAGLQVELCDTSPGDLRELAGHYSEYRSPAGRAPQLRVQFETEAALAAGTPLPGHPRFDSELVGPRQLRLTRFDAIGDVALPSADGEPVTMSFRSGGNKHSLEAAVRIGVSLALPRIGGLVFHASAIATDDGARLFLGESGAGKSTISSMLGDSSLACRKISDELVAVVYDEQRSRWLAHVTPFIGGAGLPHGQSWPVKELYFLRQAPVHRRTRRPTTLALRELLRHVLAYVAEPDTADRVLGIAVQLATEIPCYELEFRKDLEVADVLGIAPEPGSVR